MDYKEQNQRTRDYKAALRSYLADKYDNCCGYCGDPLSEIHIDHIDPFGGDVVSNYMASCPSCNQRKRQLSIEEFREIVGLDRVIEDLRCEYPDMPARLNRAAVSWMIKHKLIPHQITHFHFHFETCDALAEYHLAAINTADEA